MAQQPIPVSIFDINLRARKATPVVLAVLMVALTVVPTVLAQTFTVLHTFNGRPDGREPIAGVTKDAAGNLYGTTYYGGANDVGLVYKLAHRGSGWVLSPLYSFQQAKALDGSAPVGGVTIGSDGNLYGTATRGGPHDAGTVYKLSPPATVCRSVLCPWTETPLYQFTDGADGGYPQGTLVFDSAGNLYGTASGGGTGNNGVVFKLTHSGSGWTESVLHTFTGSPDGSAPIAGVTFDANGNLYGTTDGGGGSDDGTVYELSPSGSGWTENVLYAFQYSNDGASPYAGVVLDPEGNLYGTTIYGGAGNGGTIFELMPSNGNWIFSVLYSPELQGSAALPVRSPAVPAAPFTARFSPAAAKAARDMDAAACSSYRPPMAAGCTPRCITSPMATDGGNPEGGLILDSAGNLYDTSVGSAGEDGNVFEVTP